MELNPAQTERLRKVTLAALATVASYEVVHYVRKGELTAHTYRFKDSVMVGFQKGRERINQFTASYDGQNIESNNLTESDIPTLEAIYEVPSESDENTQ